MKPNGLSAVEKIVRDVLSRMGAIIVNSHIVYVSGRHGSAYVNKDILYTDPRETSRICRIMADEIREYCFSSGLVKLNIHCDHLPIVGPACGGIALSQWTAFHLKELGVRAIAVYADKTENGGFVLKRGYNQLVSHRKVVVVEDVITSGISSKETINAVKFAGGDVIMVTAICNRGQITAKNLDVPHLHSLLNIPLDSWLAEECPLCAQGVPVDTSVGHGQEFLASKVKPVPTI